MTDDPDQRSLMHGRGYFALLLCFSATYTVLRFKLNSQFLLASWQQLYDLDAAIPFGYRILIPLASRPLVWAGLSIESAYTVWEIAACVLLGSSLRSLFRIYVEDRWANGLSLAIFFVLPLTFLLKTKWPVFYPSDTIAMVFVVVGLTTLLRQRWAALCGLLLVATLNRESAILLPMMFVALYGDRLDLKRVGLVLASLLGLYVVVRFGLDIVTRTNPRPYGGSMAFLLKDGWRINSNLAWLMDWRNGLICLSALGFAPVTLFALRREIPPHLSRLIPIIASYFAMLLFIGNLYESRIYGEIVVIAFVLQSLAFFTYLTGQPVRPPDALLTAGSNELAPIAAALDRWGLVVITATVALVAIGINLLGVDAFYDEIPRLLPQLTPGE